MKFILIAHDHTDDGALDRRMAARAAHIAECDASVAKGTLLFGAALLDDAGKMKGSTMVFDFPDRAAFDAWLETEPYITGNVWDRARIEVYQGAIGPSFTHLFESAK